MLQREFYHQNSAPWGLERYEDDHPSFASLSLIWASQVAQQLRIACQCKRWGFNSWAEKTPLKKEMVTHSNILAWETSWTEEPGRLQSMALQKRWIWQPLNNNNSLIWSKPKCKPNKMSLGVILNNLQTQTRLWPGIIPLVWVAGLARRVLWFKWEVQKSKIRGKWEVLSEMFWFTLMTLSGTWALHIGIWGPAWAVEAENLLALCSSSELAPSQPVLVVLNKQVNVEEVGEG